MKQSKEAHRASRLRESNNGEVLSLLCTTDEISISMRTGHLSCIQVDMLSPKVQ